LNTETQQWGFEAENEFWVLITVIQFSEKLQTNAVDSEGWLYLFMSPTHTLYGAVCCHDICGIHQYKMNKVYNDQGPVIAMHVLE
jgi:hypothetical protein